MSATIMTPARDVFRHLAGGVRDYTGKISRMADSAYFQLRAGTPTTLVLVIATIDLDLHLIGR